ncbi:unnamed protein product [Gordionus sp. m RMFG-2023]
MTQTLKGINYIRNNSSIVNTSHLLEILNDHGNITLFLPISNSGFGLERNIIPEYLHRGLILNDMRKVTIGSESYGLHFTIHKPRMSTRWAVNCVPVIKDYFTTQGMIYKLKEDFPRTKQTVYDFLKQQELNSTMAKSSGLANLTLNPGKYHTIILPSNSAINQLSQQLIQELEFNVKCAKVLIPDNAAFLNLDQNIKEKLRENTSYAKEFLENHIALSNALNTIRHLEGANGSMYNDITRIVIPNNIQCVRKISKKIYHFCGVKFRFIAKVTKNNMNSF